MSDVVHDYLTRLQRSRGRYLHLPVLAGAALLTLACVDGYPTEEMLPPTPARMTQMQRIEALNLLGEEADPDQRWQYRLHPGCRLEIKVDGVAKERLEVALEGARVDSDYDDVNKTYRILLLPGETASKTLPVTVFETGKWTDQVYVTALLSHLGLDCPETATPPA